MLLPGKGAQIPKCTAAETVKVLVFFFWKLHSELQWALNDNWKLCRNKNIHRQQEWNLFCKKVFKSIILRFCEAVHLQAGGNGQYKELIAHVNVKSYVIGK